MFDVANEWNATTAILAASELGDKDLKLSYFVQIRLAYYLGLTLLCWFNMPRVGFGLIRGKLDFCSKE